MWPGTDNDPITVPALVNTSSRRTGDGWSRLQWTAASPNGGTSDQPGVDGDEAHHHHDHRRAVETVRVLGRVPALDEQLRDEGRDRVDQDGGERCPLPDGTGRMVANPSPAACCDAEESNPCDGSALACFMPTGFQ